MVAGNQPNPRRANGSRRTKLIRRVKAEETHCWLCGRPVDVTLPHGLPDSPEVDEVTPVSLGGDPLDRANVRLAHRLCNQRRGNGTRPTPPTPASYETTRTW